MAKRVVVKGDPTADQKILDHIAESVRLVKSRRKGEGAQNLDARSIGKAKALFHDGLATLEAYAADRHTQSPHRGR